MPAVNIFLSPRFARVVDLLWLGPIFSFYAKLYSYFLAATATVVLTFTPLPRRTCRNTQITRHHPQPCIAAAHPPSLRPSCWSSSSVPACMPVGDG